MKRLLINAIFMMILLQPIATFTSHDIPLSSIPNRIDRFEQQRKENIARRKALVTTNSKEKTCHKILRSQSCSQNIPQTSSTRKPLGKVVLGDALHPSTQLGNQVPVIQLSTLQSLCQTTIDDIANKKISHGLEFTELAKILEKKLETDFAKIYNDTPNEHKPFYYQFLVKRGYIVDNRCIHIDTEDISLKNSPNTTTHNVSPQNNPIK